MSWLAIHPAAPLFVAFVLMPLAGLWGRRALSIVGPLAALGCLVALPADATQVVRVVGVDLILLDMTRIGRLFAFAFALYGVLAGLYAWTQTDRGGKSWSMMLVLGGVGTALAGDWLTLYFFWEMLTIASTFLVWLGRDPDAQGAGFRYAMFHIAGGVTLLGGVLYQINTGNAAIGPLELNNLAAWCILIGLATNAAVPPLHAWLPDAYPRASIYGTVFLAAFTTKSAVYVFARTFPGEDLLMWAGAVMAFYGVFYAILENNIRRLLGYHIVSQVGYMVCGVGIGTALAIDGTSAHAFCHIFYKGLLLMSAGAVVYATGRGKLTQLGDLSGPLRWTMIMMVIGSFSIAGVPLFNGFVSKSMIVSAAGYAKLPTIELILLVVGMGTFLSIACKLVWFTFFAEGHGAQVKQAVPKSMMAAMALSAVLCIVTGVPGGFQLLYDHLPVPVVGHEKPHAAKEHHEEVDAHAADHAAPEPKAAVAQAAPDKLYYHVYSGYHTFESLQLLTGTALGFWLIRRRLKPKAVFTRDVDSLYIPPTRWTVAGLGEGFQAVGRFFEGLTAGTIDILWAGVNTIGDLRRGVALAQQIAVVLFILAAVAWIALFLMG